MAPKYRVHYFDFAARGEPVRMLLSYGGIDFEDVRISYQDWPKIKPTMPLGAMPVLEIDGKMIPQCLAICRFLAAKVNLNGKDEVEDLEIDIAVATVEDISKKAIDWALEKDEAKKNASKEETFDKTIPFYLEKLEKRSERNGGYFALDRLTWADIMFLYVYELLGQIMQKDPLIDFPNLTKVKDNILAVPSIKNWIKKRPENKASTFDLKSQV